MNKLLMAVLLYIPCNAHAVRTVMEGIWTSNNSLYLSTSSPSGYLVVGGSETVQGSAFGVGGSSFTVGGGSATVAYQMTAGSFSGPVTGASSLNVLKSGDTMTGQLTTTSTITVQGNAFSVGGSTLVVAGGNVGIGATPGSSFAFDVYAPAAIQRITSTVGTNAAYSQWSNLNGVSGGVGNAYIGIESSAGNSLLSGASNYAFTVQSPFKRYLQLGNGTLGVVITVDNSNNVGIGTASPATKLHLSSGTITIDGAGSPVGGGALCINSARAVTKCTSAVDASGNCTCP